MNRPATVTQVHLTGAARGRIRPKDVNSHIPSQEFPGNLGKTACRAKYRENIRNYAVIIGVPSAEGINANGASLVWSGRATKKMP